MDQDRNPLITFGFSIYKSFQIEGPSVLSSPGSSHWLTMPRTSGRPKPSLWIEEVSTQEGQVVSNPLPDVYLVRHGETLWTQSGQHTGLTDLPLTAQGEEQARCLLPRLRNVTFAKVLTSPLQRARRTCELSGYGSVAETDRDLVEWDYGEYEGRTRAQILSQRPDWLIFRDGCPGGESPRDVAIRTDRIIARLRQVDGDALVFSSGHFLRVFIARWLGLEPLHGGYFRLGTAALSVLGFDHNSRAEPVIRLLNERLER